MLATWVVGLLAVCGCGEPDEAAKFVGDWVYQSGSWTCNDPALSVDLTGEPVRLVEQDRMHVAFQVAKFGCNPRIAVSGTYGVLADPPAYVSYCQLSVPGKGITQMLPSAWTLNLAGQMLTATASGSMTGCSSAYGGSGILVPGPPNPDAGTWSPPAASEGGSSG